MAIETKALAPDLAEAYIDFFDHRAFSDGSPFYPCYCNAYNMSTVEIEHMREAAKRFGGGAEGWQKSLRESAAKMVKEGRIRGYLAFDKGIAIGWCNANDRMNYYRVGEFDLDHVPEDRAPSDCRDQPGIPRQRHSDNASRPGLRGCACRRICICGSIPIRSGAEFPGLYGTCPVIREGRLYGILTDRFHHRDEKKAAVTNSGSG